MLLFLVIIVSALAAASIAGHESDVKIQSVVPKDAEPASPRSSDPQLQNRATAEEKRAAKNLSNKRYRAKQKATNPEKYKASQAAANKRRRERRLSQDAEGFRQRERVRLQVHRRKQRQQHPERFGNGKYATSEAHRRRERARYRCRRRKLDSASSFQHQANADEPAYKQRAKGAHDRWRPEQDKDAKAAAAPKRRGGRVKITGQSDASNQQEPRTRNSAERNKSGKVTQPPHNAEGAISRSEQKKE